ncbi:hypothetical protein BCV72DRAFT_250846 [Rhizopus microsporus var. microsporus]|uniref:Uncharacterized protein n=1 Tax=Rhizopus microsporus var. microsporus TaxID=86635 RepID=A0A1X0QZ56_RHIZD|nr:hypothetical protein BCV72DRAFT_250846 [Rhizopus microsporus var. microsporus]
MVCKACQKKGYANKSYYKCKYYKEPFADDGWNVGWEKKKRKQSSGVKQEKQKAKRQKTIECSSSVTCTSCKQIGHKSARSPDCPNHMLSKNEVFSRNLGQQFKTFTRKLSFDQCVRSSDQSSLKSRMVSACEGTRQVVFRAQLFINQYTLNLKLASETSQCLSETCVQLATTYANCIVESFEARLLKYLSYLMQNTFVVSFIFCEIFY